MKHKPLVIESVIKKGLKESFKAAGYSKHTAAKKAQLTQITVTPRTLTIDFSKSFPKAASLLPASPADQKLQAIRMRNGIVALFEDTGMSPREAVYAAKDVSIKVAPKLLKLSFKRLPRP